MSLLSDLLALNAKPAAIAEEASPLLDKEELEHMLGLFTEYYNKLRSYRPDLEDASRLLDFRYKVKAFGPAGWLEHLQQALNGMSHMIEMMEDDLDESKQADGSSDRDEAVR